MSKISAARQSFEAEVMAALRQALGDCCLASYRSYISVTLPSICIIEASRVNDLKAVTMGEMVRFGRDLWVVDDEPAFCNFVCEAGQRQGWNTKSFSNGRDFIAKLEHGKVPRALILDIFMPGMDGFETLANIRSGESKICVLIATGNGANYAEIAKHIAEYAGMEIVEAHQKPLRLEVLNNFLGMCDIGDSQ